MKFEQQFIKLSLVSSVFMVGLLSADIQAATVDIDIDGGNGFITVDDNGGWDSGNEMNWDGQDHTATVSLAVYDAISEDFDHQSSDDYKGVIIDDQTNTWGVNQSGIAVYNGVDVGLPSCVGEFAADDDGGGTVPVSFEGTNTGLKVEMFAFGGASAPFVIHSYTITNITGSAVDIQAAHFSDFDVANSSTDHEQGYDAANELVWQWDNSPAYIAGTALLSDPVSNFFLEDCCTMSFGFYADQKKHFLRVTRASPAITALPRVVAMTGRSTLPLIWVFSIRASQPRWPSPWWLLRARPAPPR